MIYYKRYELRKKKICFQMICLSARGGVLLFQLSWHHSWSNWYMINGIDMTECWFCHKLYITFEVWRCGGLKEDLKSPKASALLCIVVFLKNVNILKEIFMAESEATNKHAGTSYQQDWYIFIIKVLVRRKEKCRLKGVSETSKLDRIRLDIFRDKENVHEQFHNLCYRD